MAEDVAPKILEELKARIDANTAEKRQEARILVKAEKGNAGFQDAIEYAKLRGQDVGNAVREISTSALPNGKMYYNIADRTIRPVLEDLSEDVLHMASDVVKAVNKKAGIGITAQIPDETEKIQGIVDACTKSEWDDIREEIGTACETFSRKCIDDTVRENAKFQAESGMNPKVIRTAASGACTWCTDVAGTYDYDEVRATGSDVWRRHANCDCVVEFQPSKGKRELVSSAKYHQNRESLTPQERERRVEERREPVPINLQLFAEKGLKDQTDDELRNGIAQIKKSIKAHMELLDNPGAKVKGFKDLDPRYQSGLEEWWKKEIKNMNRQIEDREKELIRRHVKTDE